MGSTMEEYEDACKVCLQALDRMDTGKTKLDSNFLKLCHVIVERTVVMRQTVEALGDSSELSTRFTFDCMRIYMMLEAQLPKAFAAAAEVEETQLRTERMFADLLVPLGTVYSDIAFEELLKLGEVCSLLCSQVAQNGPAVLTDCQISLPLSDVEGLPKVMLRINDPVPLFAIQSLWAFAACAILSANPPPLQRAGLVRPLYQQVASLTVGNSSKAPHVAVFRLCSALSQLSDTELVDLQTRANAVEGLFSCLQEYLVKAMRGVSLPSGEAAPALERSEVLAIKAAISAVFDALASLLQPGENIPGFSTTGGDSSQYFHALSLIKLLNYIVTNKSEVCASPPLRGGKGHVYSASDITVEFSKQIVSFIATQLLSSLRQAIKIDDRWCPSAFFLVQCCIDVPTQAAAVSCLLTAVRGPGVAAAIWQWAESSCATSPQSLGAAGTTAGAGSTKKTKKASFAPDVEGGTNARNSETKRRRVSLLAAANETPMALDSMPSTHGGSQDALSASKAAASSTSALDTLAKAARNYPLLSELQGLFFVLQELCRCASLGNESENQKLILASILFESFCAIKSLSVKPCLDAKENSGTIESAVFSIYLACHREVIDGTPPPQIEVEGQAQKLQENPNKKSKTLTMKSISATTTLAGLEAQHAPDPFKLSQRHCLIWSTIHSLCRIMALSPQFVVQLPAPLLTIMTSALSAALPISLHHCAEKQAADSLLASSLSKLLPSVPLNQAWLRDVFHRHKSFARALTQNVCQSNSHQDLSNSFLSSLKAFDECLLLEDYTSICFHLAALPIPSTGKNAVGHSFGIVSQHLLVLDESQWHYLPSFAAKHVQQLIVVHLSLRSPLPSSETLIPSLDKSMRLVKEFFKFAQRSIDAPVGQGMTSHIRDPFSVKNLFDSIASIASNIPSLLLKSLAPEKRALKKCLNQSTPLFIAFSKDQSASPVNSLVHVQLLKQADLWIKASKIRPGNHPSDIDLPVSFSDDYTSSIHPSAALAAVVAPALAQLWSSLKGKVAYIVKVADEMPGHFSSAASLATDESAGAGEVDRGEGGVGHKGASEKYWTRHSTIGCSLLDFFVQLRSAIGVVHACLCDEERDHANFKALLLTVANDIDELVNNLIHSGVVDFHPIQTRLSQLITISMLDSSFQEGLLHPNDHMLSTFHSGKQSGAQSLLGSQLVNPPVGGRFGSLLREDMVAVPGKTQRDPQSKERQIMEKLRTDRQYVALSAFSSFLEHNILLNPSASIWALSSMIELWVDNGPLSPVARMCFEELSHIAGKKKLLSYLLVTNSELVVDWIVRPLILRESSSIAVASILNILTVNMFGWAAPSDSESYEDLKQSPESALEGKGRGPKIYRPEQYILYVGDSILSGLASCHDAARTHAARVRMANIGPVFSLSKLGVSNSLIDERPFLLYKILVSSAVQDMDERDLVRGELLTYLKECAEQLKVAVQVEPSDNEVIVTTTIHHVLVYLVWDLGSSERTHDIALKGLKVIATIFKSKKWTVGGNGKSKSEVQAADLNEHVANLLSTNFLYVMSNLLQHAWAKQTQNQQEQSVRALRCVVCLLKQSDLTKFLPNIMSVVDPVLGSNSQRVRFAGVELTGELCNRLPHDVLCDNLSALVVGLFAVVESGSRAGQKTLYSRGDAEGLALVDLQRLGVMFVADFKVHEPSMYESKNAVGLSKDMTLILEAAYAPEVSRLWADKAKSSAIQIIKALFLTRRRDIARAIQSVAYIPAVAELESVRSLHAEEQQSLGLVETIKLLLKILKHDSVHVRAMALGRLLDVCHEHKKKLYQIIKSSAENAAYVVGSAQQDIVSTLLQDLLTLISRDREKLVVDACAKCLGELGAIDPANVTIEMQRKTKEKPQQMIVSGLPPIDRYADLNTISPWEVSALQLGLNLLEHHLVPDMKSSTAGQDRTGFAIQQVLTLLWVELQNFPNPSRRGSLLAAAASRDAQGAATKPEDKGPLPEQLSEMLQNLSILDVTAPYWNSKYRLQGSQQIASPVYRKGLSFENWLSRWVKQLLQSSKGRNHEFFDACRGVLKTRPALSQFVLPSILVGKLLHPNVSGESSSGHSSAEQELAQEICHVLKGGETATEIDFTSRLVNINPDAMAVQAIFSLLDTLSNWSSRGLAAKLRRPQPVAHGSSSVGSTTNQTLDSFDEETYHVAVNAGRSIRQLLDSIPKMLLCSAALSIKAYARALRYLELHLRQLRWNERDKALLGVKTTGAGAAQTITVDLTGSATLMAGTDTLTRTLEDGSNGEVPLLAPSQIDVIMQIFSKLEDPDALQGLLVLAQKQGHRPSSANRILELEQSDDWLGALLEYGLMQSASNIGDSTNTSTANCSSLAARALVSKDTFYNPPSRPSTPASISRFANAEGGTSAATVEDNSSATRFDVGMHERGRLKCLLELGHLDAVVDQALGAIQRIPQLEPVLLPLGVEASWRLMQWDNLESWLKRAGAIFDEAEDQDSIALSLGDKVEPFVMQAEDSYSVSIGKLMLSLRLHQKFDFQEQLLDARRSTMLALSAASMESYRRAYPFIVRLQVLSELEEGFTLMATHGKNSASTSALRSALLTDKWRWNDRLECMSPSIAQRSFVLAVRRTLLGASGLSKLVADNLLSLAKQLSGLGRYEAARIALQHAGRAGLDSQETILNEALLLKEAGQVHKALMLLEPVEPDCLRIRLLAKSKLVLAVSEMTFAQCQGSEELANCNESLAQDGNVLPEFLSCKEKKLAFCERLLLGTQLMIESRAKHGQHIIDRYKCLVDLHPKWEKSHFHFARYCEFLYHDSKRKDLLEQTSAGQNPTAKPALPLRGGSSKQSLGQGGDDNHTFMCTYAVRALKEYCKCIHLGLGESMLMQALPRMLTLWFSFSSPETRAKGMGQLSEQEKARSDCLFKAKAEASGVLKKNQELIKNNVWFACMPQLVSRTGHRNTETLDIVKEIIKRVLVSYPHQGIWHVAGLVHSLLQARKELGDRLINEAYLELKKRGDSASSNSAEMLRDSKKLFLNLVELAAHQHKDRRLKWVWPVGVEYRRILVPNQHVLARVAPEIESRRGTGDTSSIGDSTLQFIREFQESVDVAASKAKPKTIVLNTTMGTPVKFLCKQEKNGDLRKDARMMEFNTVINRLLQHDLEGRRRNLRLRTYAVVCLNEECGILEWVDNTSCIRHCIQAAHVVHPQVFPSINTKELYAAFIEMQEKFQDDMAALVREYRALVLDHYRPCFHRWFIEKFSDPTAWLEARVTFTRSCAVWAAVGHVIGLGDRHTENLLIDQLNGECVHVDFDCLFDKGLQLARPEIVPFRLTPNLVDAMGLTGVEGTFRRTMEVCFYLMRENKETLLSVLEPFLRDPTVAWGRGGRAQRAEIRDAAAGGGGFKPVGGDKSVLGKAGGGAAEVQQDSENPEVKEALEKITGRLNGIYNLTSPVQERILRKYQQRGQPPPKFGTGAGKDESHPLSVEGQVSRLIDEAKAVESLAQMYIGWTGWS